MDASLGSSVKFGDQNEHQPSTGRTIECLSSKIPFFLSLFFYSGNSVFTLKLLTKQDISEICLINIKKSIPKSIKNIKTKQRPFTPGWYERSRLKEDCCYLKLIANRSGVSNRSEFLNHKYTVYGCVIGSPMTPTPNP